jgi:pimeloyl-ACP methyl ester carboxylesterase
VQEATERMQLTPAFQRAQLSEEEHVFRTSVAQLRAARRPLGDLPLIVLTKDLGAAPADATPERLARREAGYRVWVELGRRTAALSTRGVQRVVPGAGHGINLDEPEAVVAAVDEMLAIVRPTGTNP